MQTGTTKPPDAASFHRTYPGTTDQVRQVREDLAAFTQGCPFADDLILMASELVTNALMHSKSGQPDGAFTVRAEVRTGDFAWLEVEDQGGEWTGQQPGDDEHGRGLAIVAGLAGEGNWVIEDGAAPGSRVVWAWLNWPQNGSKPS